MQTQFLYDSLIQLEVVQVTGSEVTCRVVVGGELHSHKVLNTLGALLILQ
jgi:pyruvate kinase